MTDLNNTENNIALLQACDNYMKITGQNTEDFIREIIDLGEQHYSALQIDIIENLPK
jgi:hypothetical protein